MPCSMYDKTKAGHRACTPHAPCQAGSVLGCLLQCKASRDLAVLSLCGLACVAAALHDDLSPWLSRGWKEEVGEAEDGDLMDVDMGTKAAVKQSWQARRVPWVRGLLALP